MRAIRTDRVAGESDVAVAPPHHLERAVSKTLRDQPEMQFSSLVIRRLDNGVCLEGVLEVDDEVPDVCSLVRAVAGVNHVVNRLVIRRRSPCKG